MLIGIVLTPLGFPYKSNVDSLHTIVPAHTLGKKCIRSQLGSDLGTPNLKLPQLAQEVIICAALMLQRSKAVPVYRVRT
jgi:hypothetical protein